MIPLHGDLEHTGDTWPFTSVTGGLADLTDPAITRFAQQSVDEPPLFARHSFQPDNSRSDDDDDDDDGSNGADDFSTTNTAANILLSEDFDELFI
jgi:hypothetical protein